MSALLAFAFVVGLYFLPVIIAASRKVPNVGSIAVINFFLGWTLIGWVVALAMALRSVPPLAGGTVVTVGANAVTGASDLRLMKRCPDCAELVQPDARICRYCHFNFDTATGIDGEPLAIEAPPGVAPAIAPAEGGGNKLN